MPPESVAMSRSGSGGRTSKRSRIAAAGTAAIVVSSDLDELAQICSRVLAFGRGRIVAELTRGEITVEALTLAVGGVPAARR